jgi:hypothetical protein
MEKVRVEGHVYESGEYKREDGVVTVGGWEGRGEKNILAAQRERG